MAEDCSGENVRTVSEISSEFREPGNADAVGAKFIDAGTEAEPGK